MVVKEPKKTRNMSRNDTFSLRQILTVLSSRVKFMGARNEVITFSFFSTFSSQHIPILNTLDLTGYWKMTSSVIVWILDKQYLFLCFTLNLGPLLSKLFSYTWGMGLRIGCFLFALISSYILFFWCSKVRAFWILMEVLDLSSWPLFIYWGNIFQNQLRIKF
jgi:hypothetical protein